jgi:glutamine synthetase
MIKRVFARHGYMATMSPKPVSFDERQYNGQHTHISISPPTKEEAFLAGILGRLSAICALGMPYEVSYSRLKPKLGGNVIGWGTEDRDVPIRKIKAGHWEMRNVDATSNMYLTLAAIIAAGLLGIENSEPLKWKDNSIPSVQRTAELCRLPCGLEDALDELEKRSEELGRMMESSILKHYLFVKRSEIGETRKLSPDKLKNLLVEMF